MKIYALTGFIIALSTVINLPILVWADDDINFINDICIQGMASLKTETDSFCSCVVYKVKKKITYEQRVSIREAKQLMISGKPVPQDIFQKSGLKAIIENSQDQCMESLKRRSEKIRDKQHKKYASLANRSVNEFDSFLSVRCNKYPKSKRHEQCLVETSKEWLLTKGRRYSEIPSVYITGNDLAKDIIEHLQ